MEKRTAEEIVNSAMESLKAFKWWHTLSTNKKSNYNVDKAKIVRDVRNIFNKENIHIVICENCKEYHYSDKDRCSCGSNTFSKTHESNWVHIK